jgi:hypothetical protein
LTEFRGHRVWWDEGNQIARAVGGGPADLESAEWILAETERIAVEHGPQVDWLLDLSGITKTTSASRKVLVKSSGHSSIRKYALVGASTFIKTVSNLIMAATGQTNARHFATEAEALAWLKGD